MKRFSLLFLFAFFIISCNAQYYPLKTKYSRSYSILIDKSYDQVWLNILSYIGAKKYGADTIEKSKGVILLKAMNFTKNCSFEWSDGTPVDSSVSFMVCNFSSPQHYSVTIQKPFRIYINWRITVMSDSNQTKVTIRHEVNYFNYHSIVARPEKGRVELDRGILESTGKFEKNFLEQLK